MRMRPFGLGRPSTIDNPSYLGVTSSPTRVGPSLVLLEHHPAPGSGEGTETLDLVRIGADGSARWSRVWPTPEENPRHAGLGLWMAGYGHQIVGRPASWFDWCDGNNR
jgi:hypothetical protein